MKTSRTKVPLPEPTRRKGAESVASGSGSRRAIRVVEQSSETAALRKVLELERSRGYADQAVIGGLDRYLYRWWGRFGDTPSVPEKLRLPPPAYATLSPVDRKGWVEEVLALLQGIEEEKENKEGKAVPGGKMPGPVPRAEPLRNNSSRADGQEPQAKEVGLGSNVRLAVKGVSSSLASKLEKLGVKTVRDLLYLFPRRHLDYSRLRTVSGLQAGEEQSIVANVWEARATIMGGRPGTEAIVGDETGNIRVVWFNQPYLAKRLPTNSTMVISGRVSQFRGMKVFESPEWELLEGEDLTHTGRLVPVYPLTQGLHQRQLRKVMKEGLAQWVGQVEDFLPLEMKTRCSLPDLPYAIYQAHYPQDELSKDQARRRLAFDELFLLQMLMLSRKQKWQEKGQGRTFRAAPALISGFLEALPFSLTGGQHRVLQEILTDLQEDHPMARLLQGEVGSGKTVVAFTALLPVIANGCQAAFMAPTEILAEQHFDNACRLFSSKGTKVEETDCMRFYEGILSHPIGVALLVGDLSKDKKTELRSRVKKGDIDIIIGTHAIIQKAVEFKALGMVVVDEQHRFGVLQRTALREKGFHPHVLAMTATPIPRTLALTLYGDLDISVIDELPPGRQEVKTKWIEPEQRGKAYSFLGREIAAGHQAFIICPLIEESESIETRAAIGEYRRLSVEVFPRLRLGLLHGKMNSREKDEVMRSFRAGALDILVSTPVVEVGIDVPNATVMLVEGAERFGLAQLHQFRGRVGRGPDRSYCLLSAEDPTPEARGRLALLEKMQDGFALAEADLSLRGPGEFLGTRQSGLPDLRMARLSDVGLLETARAEALRIFNQDPGLEAGEHLPLREAVAGVWQGEGEWS